MVQFNLGLQDDEKEQAINIMDTEDKKAKTILYQAPLPYFPQQVSIATRVTEAGGFGVYSTAGKTAIELENDFGLISQMTDKPIAIHINVSYAFKKQESPKPVDDYLLKKAFDDLGISKAATFSPPAAFNKIIDIVRHVNLNLGAIIFQNGIPNDEVINFFNDEKIETIAIASNLLELAVLEESPIGSVILQSIDAAGVLSKFSESKKQDIDFYSCETLLSEHPKQFKKPLIIWGGFFNKNYAKAILDTEKVNKNIKGIMLDSPFWFTKDAGFPLSYIDAIKGGSECTTKIEELLLKSNTKLLSNRFRDLCKSITSNNLDSTPYVTPIINAAIEKDHINYMPIFFGRYYSGNKTKSLASINDVISYWEDI